MSEAQSTSPLRRGWTTGACASGAARAAFEALLTGQFPDPVPVALPKGLRPEFALATHELRAHFASVGIVKDAGDDPDVTHGALIVATVRRAPPGAGVSFKAGEGVGMVTRPGLPLPVGEPAINPAPRAMVRANLEEALNRADIPTHFARGAVREVDVVIAAVTMSISRKVRPCCRRSPSAVRTMANIRLARWAPVVQILEPLTL